MSRKSHPRPLSASAAGYLLVLTALVGAMSGFYEVNSMKPDESLAAVLPFLVIAPFFSGLCSGFIFQGRNWARLLYWVVVGPTVVTGLLVQWGKLNAFYTGVFAAATWLLATRNSHWFFSQRDYRRRPVQPADYETHAASRGSGNRKRYEY